MNKPKTYDSYKKDKATHKYDMTYVAMFYTHCYLPQGTV